MARKSDWKYGKDVLDIHAHANRECGWIVALLVSGEDQALYIVSKLCSYG